MSQIQRKTFEICFDLGKEFYFEEVVLSIQSLF